MALQDHIVPFGNQILHVHGQSVFELCPERRQDFFNEFLFALEHAREFGRADQGKVHIVRQGIQKGVRVPFREFGKHVSDDLLIFCCTHGFLL